MSTSGFGTGGYGTGGYGGSGLDVFRAPNRTQISPKPATNHLEQSVTNILVTTLSVVAAPFITPLFPNPASAAPSTILRTHTQNALTLGPFPKPFQQTDWQNPRGPVPAIALRTHIETRKTYYVDQFFGLAGKPNFDQPNPRGPQRASTLDAFTPSRLPITAKPFLQRDYPNPRGYARAVVDFQLSGLSLTFVPKPFAQTDYPNPRGYSRTVADFQLSSLSLTGTLSPYPAQGKNYDWPNPRGYTFPSELRGYVQQATVRFIGQDRFFGLAGNPTFDWPNPRGPIPAIVLRTHVVNLQQTPFTVPPAKPFDNKNYDWPVPKGPVFPIVLRGLVNAHMPMPTWGGVDTSNSAGWGPISGVNSPGWGPVSDANSVTWVLVNASTDTPTGFK